MNKKGFTLIEIITVLAIVFVLTSIVLVTYATFRKTKALELDTQTIIEVLKLAQSQTISSQNASQYGVHFASSTVTLFTGTSYAPSTATNQVFKLKTSDIIMNIALVGSSTNVIFNRLTGETTQSGTITISIPGSSASKTITIYKTGIIQSPGL